MYPARSNLTLYFCQAFLRLHINCWCCERDGCVHGCERVLTAGTGITTRGSDSDSGPQCPNNRLRKRENGKYRAIKKRGKDTFTDFNLGTNISRQYLHNEKFAIESFLVIEDSQQNIKRKCLQGTDIKFSQEINYIKISLSVFQL